MHKLFKGGNEPKLRTKQPQLVSTLPAATDQLSISHRFVSSTYCLHSTRLGKKRCQLSSSRPLGASEGSKACPQEINKRYEKVNALVGNT